MGAGELAAHSCCMPSDASTLRVFLADDSAAIRSRVAGMLLSRALEVVGEAETPQACIDGILATHPDVVVLGGLARGLRAAPGFDQAYAAALMAFRRDRPVPVLDAVHGDDGALLKKSATKSRKERVRFTVCGQSTVLIRVVRDAGKGSYRLTVLKP